MRNLVIIVMFYILEHLTKNTPMKQTLIPLTFGIASAVHLSAATMLAPTGNTTHITFDGDTSSQFGPGSMTAQGAAGATDVFTTSTVGGVAGTGVMTFTDRASNADGYHLNVGFSGASDGGSDVTGVEQFTMIFDIRFTDASQSFLGLWNGSNLNANDSELFVRPDTGGIYINGASHAASSLTLNTFHRVVHVNDNINNTSTVYVDGTQIYTGASPDYVYDGSAQIAWMLTDNSPGETADGQIAAFGFTDSLLTPTQVANLGGVDAAGIFTVVPEPATTTLFGLGSLALLLRRRR